ncbi:MAG: GNAT family N-acetyltransferase [Candidatus Marinimicrobia bacterium]|nr:GNAT family N-acetyltransferase [Candidatus Neomarinimicrobiota bacterium]
MKHYQDHQFGWWAVEEIDVGKLIGWNGLQYLPETNEVEVAYLLSRKKWGQGLASEGAQASLQFGFEVLQLETIIGITHLENKASQKVLEKIGMHSRERNHYFGMDCYKYIIHNPKHSSEPSADKPQ